MTSIYGDEFNHVPDNMVVLIAELRKIRDAGETVTFTPAMIDFVLCTVENVTYSFESMTEYCLQEGIISQDIAKQWKAAYTKQRNGK